MSTTDDILEIVHRYYPRGIESTDPRYREAEETARLMAARRRAGTDRGAWRAVLKQIGAQFPHAIVDRSLHLATGKLDAGYAGALHLPAASGERVHALGFVVSFLVPHYVVYSSRIIASQRPTDGRIELIFADDTCHIVPAGVVKPELRTQVVDDVRQEIAFDLSPGDVPYADAIGRAIVGSFDGYTAIPPQLGEIVVPDVATPSSPLGAARIYDCLFADDW
jgi:hypothetical protein